MKTTIDISSAVSRWCRNQFLLRASYYTGRGVNHGDLNSRYLEMIYQGLKKEVNQNAATNFARFVNNCRDLTASGFIQAFEYFWASGCEDVEVRMDAGIGNQLSGRGDELMMEGLALIAFILGGRIQNPHQIEAESLSVKADFIRNHRNELTD